MRIALKLYDRRRHTVWTTLVAAALAVYSQVEIWWPDAAIGVGTIDGDRAILTTTALLITLPLAFRRTAPLPSLAAVMSGVGLQALLTTPTQSLTTIVAMMLSVFSVAAYAEIGQAVFGAALVLAAVSPAAGGVGDYAFAIIVFGSVWAAGRAIRRRQVQAAELEQRATQLAHDRDRAAGVAASEERARIARELHDLVAHSVSTMVVQARAGDRLVSSRPEAARESFRSIEQAGRQALVELRHLLGLLRDPDDLPERAPQPGLERIDELLDAARGSGLTVRIEVKGVARPLPSGIDLTAYRLIQEALTNAIRHAGATTARVVIGYRNDAVELEVHDDGRGDAGNGPGHGLIGMRERVALYGGTLESGPAGEDGGWTVRARLPVGSEAV